MAVAADDGPVMLLSNAGEHYRGQKIPDAVTFSAEALVFARKLAYSAL